MNKWMGCGRLTKEPELDTKESYTMARFTLAVDREYRKDKEKETDFISCKAFGKTAEFIKKWFGKGDPILVSDASIQTSSSMKDGKTMYYTNVLVRQVEFVPKSRDKDNLESALLDDLEELEGLDKENLPF